MSSGFHIFLELLSYILDTGAKNEERPQVIYVLGEEGSLRVFAGKVSL